MALGASAGARLFRCPRYQSLVPEQSTSNRLASIGAHVANSPIDWHPRAALHQRLSIDHGATAKRTGTRSQPLYSYSRQRQTERIVISCNRTDYKQLAPNWSVAIFFSYETEVISQLKVPFFDLLSVSVHSPCLLSRQPGECLLPE